MAAQQKYSEENSSHQSKSTLYGESAGKLHGSSLLEREWGTVMATPEEDDIGEVMEHTDTIAKSSVCSDSSYGFHFKDGSEGKTPYLDTESMEKLKNDSIWDQSLSPSKMEPCTVSRKNQETHIAGFDLNEDIKPNATDDDCIQQEVMTLSSHGVIKVVAKAGIANDASMFPSKFEGQMCLTWSGETSAFRRVVPSKTMDLRTCSAVNSQKKRKLFSGIDLNVAAVEQSVGNGSPLQHFLVEDSRKAKRLEIDLNSLCDVVDEHVQSSLSFTPPVPTSPVVDLNLNINLSSKNKSDGVDWLGRGRQVSSNEAQNTRNAEQLNIIFTNNGHWMI